MCIFIYVDIVSYFIQSSIFYVYIREMPSDIIYWEKSINPKKGLKTQSQI